MSNDDMASRAKDHPGGQVAPMGERWMSELTWDEAPADVTLWGVYGPDCFPTMFACRLRDYPTEARAIWGFSVYRRVPGFRTLGAGKAWAEKTDLRLFSSRHDAFAYVASLFPDDAATAT